MKIILLIIMTSSFVFSSSLSKLYKMYEKQEYDKACDYAFKYYSKNKKDEKYLTLYGLSCVETDKLSRVAVPMIHLTQSEDARANASYFSTILLQKQLLMQSLIDGKNLEDLHLPRTNFVLSKIFYLFIEKKYELKNNIYILEDEKKEDVLYKLYIKSSKKDKKYMIIDIYKDEKFTKRYRYE